MSESEPLDDLVPVTVLTGFLGAGKTTLVNHILTEMHGMKFAVIENEYGDIGIDQEIIHIKENSDAEIVEMMNGCICCTVRTDIANVVEKILNRPDKVDAIIIETTGLADPGPVVQTFFQNDLLQMRCRVDGIITVVDAKHVMMHLLEEKPDGVVNEAVEQVAFADRILLNKTDLVDEPELRKVKKAIWEINRTVQIVETQQCKVDPKTLVLINSFELERILEFEEDFLENKVAPVNDDHGHGHGHGEGAPETDGDPHDEKSDKGDHGHGHGHPNGEAAGGSGEEVPSHGHSHNGVPCDINHDDHVHDFGVGSISMTLENDLSMGDMQDWIGELLQTRSKDLFRYKGILSIKGNNHKFVFQGVHQIFTGQFMAPWGPDEKRVSKFVMIGRDLDKKEMQEQFENCAAQPLRFEPGTKVLARVEGGFKPGTVVLQWDQGNAYRIRLDNSAVEVWAPDDIDGYVRPLVTDT